VLIRAIRGKFFTLILRNSVEPQFGKPLGLVHPQTEIHAFEAHPFQICYVVWYNERINVAGQNICLRDPLAVVMTNSTSQKFYPATAHNLPIYRVEAFRAYPQLKHAIFSRNGGISKKPFQTLNLSLSVGDSGQAVEQNFQIVCEAMGVSPPQTAACHLVHKTDIMTVTRINQQKMMGYADGLITSEPNIFLFMRFADCTPLLFFDPVQNAVGLTHAGWRGTMQNAAGATIKAMANQLGSQPHHIIAVIGPSIGPCCYEVGSEVIDAADASLAKTNGLFQQNGKPGHAHFNMWEANRRQLVEAGVTQVVSSNFCTACHTDQFFSHRAELGQTGRFGVMIGLQGDTQ